MSHIRPPAEPVENIAGRGASKDGYAPGFGPGTLIATQDGELPVEWLETGDMLLTRDNGFRPITWIGRSRLTATHLRSCPQDAPVEISAAELAPALPTHDLIVSGGQQIFLKGPETELLFGAAEVLAPAIAWRGQDERQQGQPKNGITLVHIMCEQHQIIMAQGAWVATRLPSETDLPHLDLQSQRRLQAWDQESDTSSPAVRLCLTVDEGRVVLDSIRKQRDLVRDERSFSHRRGAA